MTKEEAWRKVKGYLYDALDGETADELIKVLEEPCDNCVSRQAVLDIAKSSKSNWIDNSVLFNKVNELPPVTPRQKIGHWVYDEVCSNWYDTIYKCSCCERRISFTRAYETEDEEDDVYRNYPYCHCGAKMVKPQESEDKE